MSMNTDSLLSLQAGHLMGAGRGVRVLVAEDERDTMMTLGILLRSEEFDVQLVGDGAEVSAQVREFKPHAILLDIGLPSRNGYDVASELRASFGEGCPVLIALTACGRAADKVRAHQSGFHHHVAKPYDPVRLIELLSAVGRKQPGV